MNRKPYISMVLASMLTMVGDLMGASSISQGARSTPTYGGSADTKRTKGKRHKSLTERSNRQKAKARH